MALHMHAEQRAEERVNLMFHTQVIDCTTDKIIGVLSDISTGGMRVVGERSVPPGHELQLRMPLPFEAAGANEIRVCCECRWTRRDAVSDCVHTGFRVTSIDAQQSSVLETVIDEFGIDGVLVN